MLAVIDHDAHSPFLGNVASAFESPWTFSNVPTFPEIAHEMMFYRGRFSEVQWRPKAKATNRGWRPSVMCAWIQTALFCTELQELWRMCGAWVGRLGVADQKDQECRTCAQSMSPSMPVRGMKCKWLIICDNLRILILWMMMCKDENNFN